MFFYNWGEMVGWDIFCIKNPAIFADGGEKLIK